MTVSRLQPYAVTVFAEMSALAARIGAVNLGQGFPDEDGPPAMLKTAENALAEGVPQYPPGLGLAPLREAIAAQRKRHFGTEYDPDTEVLVTVGATEAIAASVLGLVEPGSEVLLIEPFYDSYSPVIAMAGCERRAVPLVSNGRGFAIDVDGLRRAVTPRTKALILNSPHNPTGMVATDAELAAIADIAVRADLLVITDEVYEHLVFDGHRHIPLANYPGWPPTVTISSAAKMFNCTGWKIGWLAAHQNSSRACARPTIPPMSAARRSTCRGPCAEHRGGVGGRATRIVAGQARQAGPHLLIWDRGARRFWPTSCVPIRGHSGIDSTEFCAQLPERAGVAAIPMSAFCDPCRPRRRGIALRLPSVSVTTRSMRRSDGCRCCVTSRRPRAIHIDVDGADLGRCEGLARRAGTRHPWTPSTLHSDGRPGIRWSG
jgi:N-succinyldiaminopimelate aminotransferase